MMKSNLVIRIHVFIQLLGPFSLTNAFTAFFPHRNPLFHISDALIPTPVKNRNTNVNLGLNPNDIVDQIHTFQNIHDASHTISNTMDVTNNGITELLSTTFLGMGEKNLGPSAATQLDILSSMKASAPSSSSIAGSAAATPPSFQAQSLGENEMELAFQKLNSEQMNFYAQQLDIFSKLPLATFVFAIFDFFVFNRQDVSNEDMYLYDEESYMEPPEGDTPEKIAKFVGQTIIRILVALVVTYATVMASKATYHPHF